MCVDPCVMECSQLAAWLKMDSRVYFHQATCIVHCLGVWMCVCVNVGVGLFALMPVKGWVMSARECVCLSSRLHLLGKSAERNNMMTNASALNRCCSLAW